MLSNRLLVMLGWHLMGSPGYTIAASIGTTSAPYLRYEFNYVVLNKMSNAAMMFTVLSHDCLEGWPVYDPDLALYAYSSEYACLPSYYSSEM